MPHPAPALGFARRIAAAVRRLALLAALGAATAALAAESAFLAQQPLYRLIAGEPALDARPPEPRQTVVRKTGALMTRLFPDEDIGRIFQLHGYQATFVVRTPALYRHNEAYKAMLRRLVAMGHDVGYWTDRSASCIQLYAPGDLADEVAYNAHDIDDGVRSGLITLEQLHDVPLFDAYRQAVQLEYPALSPRRLLYESIRRMLSDQVYDVMAHTRAAMQTVVQRSADGVRLSPPVVGFGADMRERSLALKQFLFHNLYRHPQVMATTDWARSVVVELFHNYLDRPQEMPPEHRERANRHRAVADYIAGMTDRFATREHARLCPNSATAINHPMARPWP